MAARTKAAAPANPDALKRERAGTYRTADGRFTIEGSSSGWLLLDAEQADELGLPLARGPFATLDAAKAAIEPARSGPAPTSDVRARGPRSAARDGVGSAPVGKAHEGAPATRKPARKAPPRPKPGVVIREMRTVDGDALRALWTAAGFRSLGDDDKSLARLARRNPGLVLVAADGSRVVGSALGAWDGRRGWLYHVATAKTHRRQGIAKRLITEIEDGLRSLGCPKVNVIVREDTDGGEDLWRALGYELATARQFGKRLEKE